MRVLVLASFAALVVACSSSTEGTSTPPDHQCAKTYAGTWTIVDVIDAKTIEGNSTCKDRLKARFEASASVDGQYTKWIETEKSTGDVSTLSIESKGSGNANCDFLHATSTHPQDDGYNIEEERTLSAQADGSLFGVMLVRVFTDSRDTPVCKAQYTTKATR